MIVALSENLRGKPPKFDDIFFILKWPFGGISYFQTHRTIPVDWHRIRILVFVPLGFAMILVDLCPCHFPTMFGHVSAAHLAEIL